MHILWPDQLNTYDVLVNDVVLFTSAALDDVPRRPDRRADAPLARGRAGREGGSEVIPDPRDILLAPVVSEKSYGLLEERQYTFIVRPDANKTQIKIAVEKVFGVKVLSVNTLNRPGKRKRTRTGYGKRKDTKRAIVTLSQESRTIDVFGGPAS